MSRSYKAQQKRINRKAAEKAEAARTKSAAPARDETVFDPERDKEFAEKYGSGGVLKNTLRIWRDSSPATFITYMPVIALQLCYAVLWFFASMFIIIPGLSDFGVQFREVVLFANMVITAALLPITETFLHFLQSLKLRRKYYIRPFFLSLSACLIYLVLGFLNVAIAVAFTENAREQLSGQLWLSLTAGGVMLGVLTLLSLLAQLFLMFRRAREEAKKTTKLGLKLDNKE